MRALAVILARGGSKRMPRKNIVDFCGKPMLAWSVEAALVSGAFTRVLVSTDDPEIASIARSCGAQAPFLRSGAADDRAPSSEATAVALAQAEAHWSEQYGVVAQLMANCPLRDVNDIRRSIDHFLTRGVRSQVSCARLGWMNPWWSAELGAKGEPSYLFPEMRTRRSQDLPPLYCPSGALWLAQAAVLKQERTFFVPDHVFYPLHWMSAIDIDDEADLEMATAAYLARSQGRADHA